MDKKLATQVTEISEKGLAKRIIHMHDVLGLGFRRLSKKLKEEGIDVSKDKVFRLYHRYKPDRSLDTEEDEDLKQIKKEEKEAERRVVLTREKEERRRTIAANIVEEHMLSHEKRKQLFSRSDRMIEFSEKVMPAINPQLWDEFQRTAEDYGYSLAEALILAFGRQADYEVYTDSSDSERQRLDLFLCERMRDRLDTWKEASDEEDSVFEEWEQHNTAFHGEEGESTCFTFFVPVEEKAYLLKLQRACERTSGT